MYDFLLILHNFLRWIVVIAAVLTLAQAVRGWQGKRPWSELDDRLGMIFTSILDLQLLVGLLLMFVYSPITSSALGNMGEAMRNAVQRFFVAEHFPLMVIAVIVAHVGRARVRRVAEAAGKHRTAALWFGLAILLILVAIPWPFMPDYGRPWLRLP